jgi:hypothetical protein
VWREQHDACRVDHAPQARLAQRGGAAQHAGHERADLSGRGLAPPQPRPRRRDLLADHLYQDVAGERPGQRGDVGVAQQHIDAGKALERAGSARGTRSTHGSSSHPVIRGPARRTVTA